VRIFLAGPNLTGGLETFFFFQLVPKPLLATLLLVTSCNGINLYFYLVGGGTAELLPQIGCDPQNLQFRPR